MIALSKAELIYSCFVDHFKHICKIHNKKSVQVTPEMLSKFLKNLLLQKSPIFLFIGHMKVNC